MNSLKTSVKIRLADLAGGVLVKSRILLTVPPLSCLPWVVLAPEFGAEQNRVLL